MKRLIAIGTMMILTGSLSWGATSTPGSTPTPGSAPTPTTASASHGGTPSFAKTGPCKQILAACNAAGFYYGEWKVGKGEYHNCLNPLLQGQSVPGVSVTSQEIAACSAHKARQTSPKASGGAPAARPVTSAPTPGH